jgi:hypothetical protein
MENIQQIRGPFAKFVDSHYYSESELCGGAVTVSFSKDLPWQAIHFLQRSTHLSKTCCRPLITSKFLASELRFHGWKRLEISWSEIWIEFCVRLGKVDRWNPIRTSAIQSRSRPTRFLGFSNHEKWSPEARNLEVINGLQHVFEKWLGRCKKCIACQGRYFEKETVIAPPQTF